MTNAIERARQIAKNVLGGQYDPLVACREIADIRAELPTVSDEVMEVFAVVASECDGLPIGPERTYWSAESLLVKDREAAIYRAEVRSEVEEALKDLLVATGNDSQS